MTKTMTRTQAPPVPISEGPHIRQNIFNVAIPAILTLALFVAAIFAIILPSWEESFLERKREMISELTKVAWSTMDSAHKKELAGLLTKEEAQKQAIEAIGNIRFGKEGKDYFWINDMQPTMVMHPYRPDLDGTDISNYSDPEGKRLFVEFVKVVDANGSGYVDYMWQWKDNPNLIVPKLSFVMGFKPWGWIVGTGIYIEDVRNEMAVTKNRLIDICLVILGVIALLTMYILRNAVLDDRKRAALISSLSNREERLRTMVEQSPLAIEFYDTKGLQTHANKAWEEMWQTKGLKAIGKFNMLEDPQIKEQNLTDTFSKALKGENILINEWHFDPKLSGWQGRDRYLRSRAYPVTNEQNEILTIVLIHEDITEAKKTERELRRLRNLLSNTFNSMPSILIGVDSDLMVTQWNLEAVKATGISEESARGQNLDRVFPRLGNQLEKIRKALSLRQVQQLRKTPFHIKNETRFEDMTVYPLIANGIEGAVVRLDDVTSRVQVEEMLIQSEKMVSVGGLAAGMAHEINNPLGVIMQSAQSAERRFSTDLEKNLATANDLGLDLNKVHEYMKRRGIISYLEGIREAGQRAARIVASMLDFTRKSESMMAPCCINEILDTSIDLAANDYDLKTDYGFGQVSIVRDYDINLPDFSMTETEIQQVILTLIKNSVQAMSEKKFTGDKPSLTMRTSREGDIAVVEVEDNGPGMDQQTIKRVFEPFFTTKQVGKGTGLGLSVSYFIITTRHDGEFEVESTVGQGTKFTIRLPMKDAS